MTRYTDPETGFTYVTTAPASDPRAEHEARLIARHGALTERHRELLDDQYGPPVQNWTPAMNVGQGAGNYTPPTPDLDVDRFNDHAYWEANRAKIQAAVADGSMDYLYQHRNH